ncbi:MAG: Uma2 family endonuclease [Alphaproteobacteria bacterium]|jgi:Uma2 family endonuclease|nr:Uma2 family endonuclease [Alphaproteobacteria bacterium]
MTGIDPVLYEKLAALPETEIGEILRGELFTSPRPAPRHANVIVELCDKVVGPFRHGRGGPGGWWILTEPEVHLGGEVVVPDLAGWRRERMPAFPDSAAVHLAPDWVCEVLSPSGGRRDRVIKSGIYAEKGVPFLWFVDPIARSLEVLRLTDEGWLIDAAFGDTDTARAKPFDAIDIPLADLWPD